MIKVKLYNRYKIIPTTSISSCMLQTCGCILPGSRLSRVHDQRRNCRKHLHCSLDQTILCDSVL